MQRNSKRIFVLRIKEKGLSHRWKRRNELLTQHELHLCGDSWSHSSIYGPVLLNSGNSPEQLQTGQQCREWKTLHKSPLECSLISSSTPPSHTASSSKSRSSLHQATETWPSKPWRNLQLWVSEVQKKKKKCVRKLAHISVVQSRHYKETGTGTHERRQKKKMISPFGFPLQVWEAGSGDRFKPHRLKFIGHRQYRLVQRFSGASFWVAHMIYILTQSIYQWFV